MNFIEHFNLFGVEAKQIPCIKGVGAPTNATEGAVGCFYMDTTNGATYKCTVVTNGEYTWEPNDGGTVKSVNGVTPDENGNVEIEVGGGSVEGAILYTPQTLTDEQKAQARANIGAAALGEGGGSAEGAVLYTEQTLTPEQKTQAIENIGAVAAEDIFKKEYSTNLLDWNAVEVGKVIDANGKLWGGESYATYTTTALIPCKPGDKIHHQFDYSGVRYDNETTATRYTNIARIAAYDASGIFVPGSYKTPAYVYTVPDGASFVRIAFINTQWGVTYKNHAIIIQDDATIVPYSEYGEILTSIIKPELDDRKIVLYSGQNLTGVEQAQARQNIGAASAADIYTGGLRAQIRQISFLDDNGYPVVFADVYMPSLDQYLTPQGQHRFFVYGLEAHSTTSTAQRVFQSKDGGETWSLFCSIPMNAANGVWYTDFAVDHRTNVIYLLKTTDGSASKNNAVCTYYKASDGNWYARTKEVSLGEKRWLSNNSFEICNSPDRTKRIAIFGEYGTTMDGTTYSLWMTTDSGTTWTKALEIQGNSNNENNGLIRHWHTVKVDPYTSHLWAASGDNNATEANPDGQCRIYRSTDGGDNWELMFSGSQRERTCGFVFEQDCIYYGMDAKSWDSSVSDVTKIVKIDKSKLDTDRDNCREDVASVDCSRSIYGLTRTFYPDGMLVYTQHEPGAVITSDTYVLEFYDYATERLYPVASFDISGISKDTYIGFYAGAKYQSLISGVIFAKPTNTMHQDKYGYTEVSKHIKINLTM